MRLAPALLRAALDTAEGDDGSAWEMACSLLDEADVDQARRAALDAVIFATRLLVGLETEHLGVLDVDDAVAAWGITLATKDLEVCQ